MFNYCTIVWMFASSKSLTKIVNLHKRALRFTMHKKCFPLRISSVNVTKSAGNWGFGHIHWKIFTGKFQFLCSVILDDYSSSYEKILEKCGKFSMVVKRKYKLCIEIYKTLNNLNSSFMKEIFELKLCSSPAREPSIIRPLPTRTKSFKVTFFHIV